MQSQTILQCLNKTKAQINIKDAEILMAHILHESKSYVIAHAHDILEKKKIKLFFSLVQKRQKGIPLAYLTKKKAFFGLDFFVNKHTLIPRPETESIVELILEDSITMQKPVVIADIGTGSGCIITSLATQIHHDDIAFMATDVSAKALRVAKKNAYTHNVDNKISFIKTNLLHKLEKPITTTKPHTLLIAANLPYLNDEEVISEPTIQFEPKLALHAELNGLALFFEFIDQLASWKVRPPVTTLYCEMNPSQCTKFETYVLQKFPTAEVSRIQDFCKKDRIVKITLLHSS